jgi:hypothetical protein
LNGNSGAIKSRWPDARLRALSPGTHCRELGPLVPPEPPHRRRLQLAVMAIEIQYGFVQFLTKLAHLNIERLNLILANAADLAPGTAMSAIAKTKQLRFLPPLPL